MGMGKQQQLEMKVISGSSNNSRDEDLLLSYKDMKNEQKAAAEAARKVARQKAAQEKKDEHAFFAALIVARNQIQRSQLPATADLSRSPVEIRGLLANELASKEGPSMDKTVCQLGSRVSSSVFSQGNAGSVVANDCVLSPKAAKIAAGLFLTVFAATTIVFLFSVCLPVGVIALVAALAGVCMYKMHKEFRSQNLEHYKSNTDMNGPAFFCPPYQ
jgi:hypothetical protein